MLVEKSLAGCGIDTLGSKVQPVRVGALLTIKYVVYNRGLLQGTAERVVAPRLEV